MHTDKQSHPGVRYMCRSVDTHWPKESSEGIWWRHSVSTHMQYTHISIICLPCSLLSTPRYVPAVETRLLCPRESPQPSPTGHCIVTPDRPHQTKRHSPTHPSSHTVDRTCSNMCMCGASVSDAARVHALYPRQMCFLMGLEAEFNTYSSIYTILDEANFT